MNPQEELDKANARVKDRLMAHRHIWRWIRNRCMQCGSRMLVRYDGYGKIKTCSVYPNHKPYVFGLNETVSYWVIIAILGMIIASGSCQKTTVNKVREPQISPKGSVIAPYFKER